MVLSVIKQITCKNVEIADGFTTKMKTWFWILGWFLSILTITGNGFIIFLVCTKRRLRTKTNAFVVSLAVADFCVGMSVVPSLYFCDVTGGCNWLPIRLSWLDFTRWLFSDASVANLCSLVLDRYIAVVKPLTYLTFVTRRRVIQMISFSWAISVGLLLLPTASHVFSQPTIFDIYAWIAIILFEFLPCFMLIFCVGAMVHVVNKHDRTARTLARQIRFNHHVFFERHEKPTTVKIMVIVVGLSLVCYSMFIRCTIVLLVDSTKDCNDVKYKIPILVLNSAVNPLTYAFLKRDIKREIKQLCNRIFNISSKKEHADNRVTPGLFK